MEKLWNDVMFNIEGYYGQIIALLPKLAMSMITILCGWLIFKLIKKSLQSRLTKVIDDPLITRFIIRVVRVVVVIIVSLLCLKIVGLGRVATGLWGTAGIGAFVIGFAFKDIGEHLLAGFMLAFSRPFRNGDVIEVNGVKGSVVGLTMRNTHLKTFAGKDVYIPNGIVIKNILTNDTIDGFIRREFTLHVDKTTNLAIAEETILEVVNAQNGVLKDNKAPSVWIDGLANGKIGITARYWHNTFDPTVDSAAVRRQAIQESIAQLTAKGVKLSESLPIATSQ